MPMPGEAMRVLKRLFYKIEGIEIEICTDKSGYRFVRHHVYWHIAHKKKNPDLKHNCVVLNLSGWIQSLDTMRWVGYKFEVETVKFDDSGMEVEEAVLLPLAMFVDLMRWHSEHEYDKECDSARLGAYFQNRSKIQVKKQGRYLVPSEDVDTSSERERRKLSSDEAIKTLQALVRRSNPEGNLVSDELIRERRLEAANE